MSWLSLLDAKVQKRFFGHKQTVMINVLGINGFLDKKYERRNKHNSFLLILQNTTVE
jgi:hypothetical protein